MEFLHRVVQLYADRSSFFLNLFIEHLYLTGTAVLIITVIGLTVGISITRSSAAAKVVLSLVNFLYTVPTIALFGFLVGITGIGSTSAVIALVAYGLIPIIRNTYVGIMEVDPMMVEAAVGMGSTDWQLLRQVQFPIALPVIIAGVRTMVVMTIALGGIASFIGAGGLGVAIWRGITTNYTEMTVAGSILVALMAIAADLILERTERMIRRKVLGTTQGGGEV